MSTNDTTPAPRRPPAVVFGAGNIGRSFIGQIFARSGHPVVFVDIAAQLLDALNAKGSYRVVVKKDGTPDRVILVEGVRGMHSADPALPELIAGAGIMATCVGQRALPAVLEAIGKGLARRFGAGQDSPLDIIIAENIRDGAAFFRRHLSAHLAGTVLADKVGLVETSIGKMVPIMRPGDLQADPLWVFAEEYNKLVVDGRGFKTPVGHLVDLDPKRNIQAFVDRKLFVHNLGHAAAAYLGYRHDPSIALLADALAVPEVLLAARTCMRQAAAALVREYPGDLDLPGLEAHIEDLLARFRNRALGDTLFRVCRDVPRKIGRHDRITGAMVLAARHGLPCDAIAEVLVAALAFRAGGAAGEHSATDAEFFRELKRGLWRSLLAGPCGLSEADPVEGRVMAEVLSRAGSTILRA